MKRKHQQILACTVIGGTLGFALSAIAVNRLSTTLLMVLASSAAGPVAPLLAPAVQKFFSADDKEPRPPLSQESEEDFIEDRFSYDVRAFRVAYGSDPDKQRQELTNYFAAQGDWAAIERLNAGSAPAQPSQHHPQAVADTNIPPVPLEHEGAIQVMSQPPAQPAPIPADPAPEENAITGDETDIWGSEDGKTESGTLFDLF